MSDSVRGKWLLGIIWLRNDQARRGNTQRRWYLDAFIPECQPKSYSMQASETFSPDVLMLLRERMSCWVSPRFAGAGPILEELERKGSITIAGAMYDLATGMVGFVG
jgi:hypothetical protein